MVDGLYGRRKQADLLKCFKEMKLVRISLPTVPFSFTCKSSHVSHFSAVVNCIQSHPLDCVVATSGIDMTIKVGITEMINITFRYSFMTNLCFTSIDLDTNCFSSVSCSWWSIRSAKFGYLNCNGSQSTKIISYSCNDVVRLSLIPVFCCLRFRRCNFFFCPIFSTEHAERYNSLTCIQLMLCMMLLVFAQK